MTKDLTQKTSDFMKEEPSKKIKATLFQKIILGAMISAPFVIVGGHYVVKHEVERMNRDYEEMDGNIKGAFIRAGIEILEDIRDNPKEYGLKSEEESYRRELPRNSQESYPN